MFWKKVSVTAIMVCCATAVNAGWLQHIDDDPFTNTKTYLAFNGDQAGFRCTKKNDIKIVVVSGSPVAEIVGSLRRERENTINILIIVDDERFEISAEVLSVTNQSVKFASREDNALVTTLAATGAKKRIAIAVQINRQIVDRFDAGIDNASTSIGSLVRNCGLDLRP
jgi:hypothetical protein